MNLNDYSDAYETLGDHVGHDVQCVSYGRDNEPPANIAVVCDDCCMVLVDVDRPDITAPEVKAE